MTHDGTANDAAPLRRFGEALQHFRSQTSPAVPSQVVQAFAAVAADEGKILSDYAAMLGSNLSTASRHFLALTDRSLADFTGHGLVVAREIPHDLRQKGFWLTERGQQLRDEMAAILNG